MKRRQILLAVGFFIAAIGSIWLAGFVFRTPSPKPDIALELFGGDETFEIFTTSTTVTAQRLHFRTGGTGLSSRLEVYEHDEAVPVSVEHAREIQRLVADEKSYYWGIAKACAPNYGVLLTFRNAKGTVRVALCFECKTLDIFVGDDPSADSVNREGDFDRISKQLVKVVQGIFPNDPVIQGLK